MESNERWNSEQASRYSPCPAAHSRSLHTRSVPQRNVALLQVSPVLRAPALHYHAILPGSDSVFWNSGVTGAHCTVNAI